LNRHPIQGWTPDFIPKITEDAIAMNLIDMLIPVEGPEAIATSSRLAKEEGIFTGISGGATIACALKACASAEDGAVLLAMVPDTAERYLSTPLFAAIEADMNADEVSISESSPNFQMPTE
jgi:cysteine synthase A